MAAVGDIRRFQNPRKLVGYLGLDPRVYQSGSAPATGGHISKQGSASSALGAGRGGLERRFASPARCTPSMSASAPAADTRSRSSPPRASSRACSGACSPASEDYAHQQPSLTAKKLRRLEIRAGAPTLQGHSRPASGPPAQAMREAERRLAEQAEASYTADGPRLAAASPAKKAGASVTPGRASQKPSKGKVARQTTSP